MPLPNCFELSTAKVEAHPFDHFRVHAAVNNETAAALGKWLEEHGNWKRDAGSFYTIEQFRLTAERVPPEFGWVVAPSTLQYLREVVASAYGAALGTRVDVDAHLMTPGQSIGIHNDFREGKETHRLVVALANAWDCDDGGLLVLLGGARPEDAALIVPPLGGSVVCFKISPVSFHAVTPVTGRCRCTLIYSFYAPEGKQEPASRSPVADT